MLTQYACTAVCVNYGTINAATPVLVLFDDDFAGRVCAANLNAYRHCGAEIETDERLHRQLDHDVGQLGAVFPTIRRYVSIPSWSRDRCCVAQHPYLHRHATCQWMLPTRGCNIIRGLVLIDVHSRSAHQSQRYRYGCLRWCGDGLCHCRHDCAGTHISVHCCAGGDILRLVGCTCDHTATYY